MHDSSLDRVALSENLTLYMATIHAANENIKQEITTYIGFKTYIKVTD